MQRLGVLLLSLFLLTACKSQRAHFSNVDITGAGYAQGFSLRDTQGTVRSLQDFRGKVVVVFFGFTQCPDVCPTTLAEMVQVKRALGQDADRLQPIFISLDPKRDTDAVLAKYIGNFDTSFIALRPASLEQLAEVAKNFRIYYEIVASPSGVGNAYGIDHTAASFVFDPQGRVRLFVRYDPTEKAVGRVVEDIRQLLRGL